MGSNDMEAALIDNVQENVRDIVDKYRTIRLIGGFQPNPEKDAAMDKWFGEQYAEWLGKLETSLPANPASVYSVGSALSYADISIWHMLSESFAERTEDAKKVSSKFKRLTAVSDAVATNAEVKKWLETRPVTRF
jgi:glutathione S-transferase